MPPAHLEDTPRAPRAESSGAADDSAAGDPGASGTLARLAWSLPDLLSAALAGFSVVAIAALLLSRFEPIVVLPLGALGALGMVAVLRPERRTVPTHELAALGCALVGVAASTYVAMRLSGEFVLAWRDPGTYALSGRWLYDHDALAVPFHPGDFGGVKGLDPASLGFGFRDGFVYAQGYHLLPALLAVAAWIARDPNFVLDGNPLIGGLALLVLYGFARRVVGAWWALVPTAVLAVSMPFIAFSRDPFTEPLAIVFAFGSMSLLWRALQTRRLGEFAAAGVVAGAGALVRVDAYLTVLGLIAAAGIILVVAERRDRRAQTLRVAVMLAAAAAPTMLGLVDVIRLSRFYFDSLEPDIRQIGKVGAALVVVGVVACVVGWQPRLRSFVVRRREPLGWLGGGLIVAGFAYLASRPWWFIAYNNDPPGYDSLAAFQKSLRLPIDEHRSYDELSISWLAWYHGWPTVVLGIVGLAVLVRTLLRTGDARLGYFLAAVLGTGAIYLNKATIFPDQVWAMRRFLPVFIPGLLIAGTLTLVLIWKVRALRIVALALAGVMFAWTLVVTWPMLRVPSYRPQLAEIETVCNALPPDADLMMVDTAGQSRGTYQMTFRAFCEVPVVGLEQPDAATLAEVAAAAVAHGRKLYVVSVDPAMINWRSAPPATPWLQTDVVKWPERLLEPPAHANFYVRGLYVGVVGDDGLVDEAPPPPDDSLEPYDAPPPPS